MGPPAESRHPPLDAARILAKIERLPPAVRRSIEVLLDNMLAGRHEPGEDEGAPPDGDASAGR